MRVTFFRSLSPLHVTLAVGLGATALSCDGDEPLPDEFSQSSALKKEEHDKGRGNESAVAVGLERTGRIVTSAALLISVVLISFASSHVTFIKLFGLGLALAVLMDAFVIRGTLVPAFMRLAGEANWWAPAWLRRIHGSIGLSEGTVLDEPVGPPAAVAPELPRADATVPR